MVMVHLLPKARRAGKSKGGDVVLGSKIGGTSTKAAPTACVKDEPVDSIYVWLVTVKIKMWWSKSR